MRQYTPRKRKRIWPDKLQDLPSKRFYHRFSVYLTKKIAIYDAQQLRGKGYNAFVVESPRKLHPRGVTLSAMNGRWAIYTDPKYKPKGPIGTGIK